MIMFAQIDATNKEMNKEMGSRMEKDGHKK